MGIAGAGGAAYCATRQDAIGEAARGAGNVVVAGAERANELNKEHKITEKLAITGKAGLAKAREVDNKFGITSKITTGAMTAASTAKSIEAKHKVTDKVAGGISMGLTKLTSLAGGRASASSGSSAPTGGYTAAASTDSKS